MSNAKQRTTLNNLNEPQQMRELNRQLSWIWDQLLGGLNMKSLSSGTRQIIEGKADDEEIRSVIEQRAGEILLEVGKPASALDTGESGVQVKISDTKFEVNVPGEDGDFELNESGGKLPVLVSKDVFAPNVTPRYAGATVIYVNPNATSAQIAAGNYYRSLADALSQLNYQWVPNGVTIHLAAGMIEYGTVTLRGTTGGGWITIKGDGASHAKIVGKLLVTACGSPVSIQYLDVDAPLNARGIDVSGGYADIAYCTVTGKGTAASIDGAANTASIGIIAHQGARVNVSGCELYDVYRSLYVQTVGSMSASDCKGNAQVGANRTQMFVSGTAPCDTAAWRCDEAAGGRVWTSNNLTVDQGSAAVPETEPVTMSFAMVHSDSYVTGWSYFEDNDIRQGCINSAANRIRGCMWFDNSAIRSALVGKTVQQASLRLYAAANIGRGVAVSVELYGTTMQYEGRSGAPALMASYGTIGTAASGEVSVITIPTQVVSDLVNGTINGLVVYSSDVELYKDRSYSRNYARFAGETSGDSATVPVLTVVADASKIATAGAICGQVLCGDVLCGEE